MKALGGLSKVAGGGLVALPIVMEGWDEYTKPDQPLVDNIGAGTTALGVGGLSAAAGAGIGFGLGALTGPAAPVMSPLLASVGAGLAGGAGAGVGADMARGANSLLRDAGILPKQKSEFDKELEQMNKLGEAQLQMRNKAIPVTRAELEMMADIAAEGRADRRHNYGMLASQQALLNAATAPAQTWDPANYAAALMR